MAISISTSVLARRLNTYLDAHIKVAVNITSQWLLSGECFCGFRWDFDGFNYNQLRVLATR